MKIKRLDIEVNYIQLCPYCKKRRIIKKTCGDFKCQYEHRIKWLREYWDKHYRKSDRIRSNRRDIHNI